MSMKRRVILKSKIKSYPKHFDALAQSCFANSAQERKEVGDPSRIAEVVGEVAVAKDLVWMVGLVRLQGELRHHWRLERLLVLYEITLREVNIFKIVIKTKKLTN